MLKQSRLELNKKIRIATPTRAHHISIYSWLLHWSLTSLNSLPAQYSDPQPCFMTLAIVRRAGGWLAEARAVQKLCMCTHQESCINYCTGNGWSFTFGLWFDKIVLISLWYSLFDGMSMLGQNPWYESSTAFTDLRARLFTTPTPLNLLQMRKLQLELPTFECGKFISEQTLLESARNLGNIVIAEWSTRSPFFWR